MVKFLKYLFTVFLFFQSLFVYSQIDTTVVEDVNQQFEQNLDSLLNAWYVKTTVSNNKEFSYNNVDSTNYKNIPDSVYIKRLAKIPSLVPLPYNDKVRKYIEFYLRHGKNMTPLIIGLSTYYYPLFEEMLDKNNMPLELKHLVIIESAFNPRAVSYAGATGLWQLMYATGKMYDLEINSLIDERRDPIKSSVAGIQFLKDLYSIYGDWSMVLAAYNCGPGNVNRALKRAKGKTSYWDIYKLLPHQTRNYVPAYIAASYIMSYYKEHNIVPIKVNMPLRTDTVVITKKLHLIQVADVLKLPLDALRDMNPQYKKDIIPANGRSFVLKLPAEYTTKFVELSDSIYRYKDSLFFNVKKNSTTAGQTYETSYKSDNDIEEKGEPPSIEGKSQITYTIKNGDTYGYIANWFGVKTSDLKYWNDTYSNRLQVGQKVIVYVPNKKIPMDKGIETMTFEQKQDFAARSSVKTKNASSKTTTKVELDNNYVYYTILSGDNLSTITKKYPGTSENGIMQLNNLTTSDVRRLRVGQIIKIKKK